MEGDVADRKCHTLHPIISIHSLRMEGDLRKKSVANWLIISIHSLRMEGDRPFLPDLHILIIFQSTPSAWRETSEHRCSSAVAPISIHSLRMEGDRDHSVQTGWSFISIHSLRMEGDQQKHQIHLAKIISIHSLRMEGDRVSVRDNEK